MFNNVKPAMETSNVPTQNGWDVNSNCVKVNIDMSTVQLVKLTTTRMA